MPRRCVTLLRIGWLLLGWGIFFVPGIGSAPRARGQEALLARVEGVFVPDGVYSATAWAPDLPTGWRPRVWGSWAGSDANTGTLTLGPFRATQSFVVASAGYPTRAGNALYLRRVRDGARRKLINFDPKECWVEVITELPESWVNEEVELCAEDRARSFGGWLGVSEPYPQALGQGVRPFSWTFSPPLQMPVWPFGPALAAFLLNSALLLAPGLSLLPLLRRRGLTVPDPLAPLAAVALSSLVGYAVFWIYWLHPLAGRWASWLVAASALGALVFQAWRRSDRASLLAAWGGAETGWPLGLALLAGCLYLGVLYFPQSHSGPGLLAEVRFSTAIKPNDNVLTQAFVERLYSGESLLPWLTGDWHSSDRPPLQVGIQLLCRPLLLLAGWHPELADQTAGVWFQLTWLLAGWAFLREAGLPRRRAVQVLAAVIPTGLLYVNSVYVWPKLCAGAFCVGAFTLLAQGPRPGSGQVVVAGALAALAYLSHGAAVFALLALGLLLLLPRFWLGWRRVALAAAVFLALNLPWVAYQKFYDPPGNRLLKWHLAGVIPIDERGAWETIRAAYATTGFDGTLQLKWSNAQMPFRGNFLSVTALSPASSEKRRNDEYYYLFRALGVWNLGWFLGLAALARWRWRATAVRLPPADEGLARQLLLGVAVSALSLLVWMLLIFGPNATVIHQGAYLAPILLPLILATILREVSGGMFAAVALFHVALFAATYLPAPPAIAAPVDPLAATVAGAAAVALLVAAAGREAVAWLRGCA